MIDLVQVDHDLLRLAWRHRFGMREAFSEADPEDLHGDGQLITAHAEALVVEIGVHVDEFDHEIRIRFAGAGEEVGCDHTRHREVRCQAVAAKTDDIRSGAYEALIFDLPGPISSVPITIVILSYGKMAISSQPWEAPEV